MDLQASLNKLYSLHTFGIKLGLENIEKFLKLLGDPHKKLKVFHIAGSNGKGSTASFIASILMEQKCRTGLYTSPHFIRFNERIKINNKEIPDEYLASFISDYEKQIDEMGLTFFEVTTAVAFKYFFDRKVDYAVIETGLGGRLDATNVVCPLASVITSISLEHTEYLGNTVTEIASEKADIIKRHSKAFIGKLPQDAVKVIEQKCQQMDTELFKLSEYIIEKKNFIELYTEEIEIDEWKIPLKGFYQKLNAALAVLTIAKTLGADNPHRLYHGIRNVIQNTGLQGRYEYFNKAPDIIFDSAHNPEGLINFLTEFKKETGYKKKVLLFGVLKDKNYTDMLKMLSGAFDEIRVTGIRNERACSSEDLKKTASNLGITVQIENDPVGFINHFLEGHGNSCLVILGSMYLLGEIKSSFQK